MIGALALSGTNALADPPSDGVPAADLVAVGAASSQAALDAIATDYAATNPVAPLADYDAQGSPSITPKAGCPSISRPTSSESGVAALKASASTGSSSCIDIARTSHGPRPGDGSSGALAFVAFAKDGVTWSANQTTNAPATLSTTQLKAIYSCDASLLGAGAKGPVTWNEVGGTTAAAVRPIIPRASSGTRQFFLATIGVAKPGSCVMPSGASVAENEGTNPIFTQHTANEVFPYAISAYLSQTVFGTDSDKPGKLVLHQIGGIAPTVGTGTASGINPAFPVLRTLFNVVRDDGSAAHMSGGLLALLGKGTGYVCSAADAKTDIRSQGLLNLGGKCGAVTVAAAGS